LRVGSSLLHQIRVLPTVVLFKSGVVKDRVTGFESLGRDDFPTAKVRAVAPWSDLICVWRQVTPRRAAPALTPC
jgi:hypothetical protein